jgi:hypothetical protein
MVVSAIAVGVGVGSLVAPSGTAAGGPVALGFLPEPGWYALQATAPAMRDQPAMAMAANVPFANEDTVHGLVEPSGLPYSTVLSLPPSGVVIVATFTVAGQQPWASVRYPARQLPLQIRDATPFIELGTQVRPEQPLGQYQLRAVVNGYHVDLHIYVGSPRLRRELAAAVQRQLDRLVVRPAGPAEEARAAQPTRTATPSAPGVIDRTYACSPSYIGGVRQIDTRAHRGSGRHRTSWDRPAFAGVETTVSGSAATAIEDELVWVSAGRPSASASVVSTLVGFTFPFRSWGTLAVNRKLCRASTSRLALGRSGLRGGAAGPIDDRWDCATGRRVFVRVRAVLQTRASLQTYRSVLRTTVPVKTASLAVRTQSGKPLVYAEVFESGKSFLYTAPSCFPD